MGAPATSARELNELWSLLRRLSAPAPAPAGSALDDLQRLAQNFGDPAGLSPGPERDAAIGRALQLIASLDRDALARPDPASGNPPLFEGAAAGIEAIAGALLGRGVPVDARSTAGKVSALARAAQDGHAGVARLLLDRGADPNARSSIKRTPLMEGAFSGSLELVRLLLERGADPSAVSDGGDTAASTARGGAAEEIRAIIRGAAGPRPGMVFVETPASERSAVGEFVEQFEGGDAWAVLAVRAACRDVAASLARRHSGAPIMDALAEALPPSREGALCLQRRADPWTVVYRSTGWLAERHLEEVPAEAAGAAAELKTTAATFMAEPTSSAVEIRRYERGELAERATWVMGEEYLKIEPKPARRPEAYDGLFGLVEERFAALGLRIPAVRMINDGLRTAITVSGSHADIEAAVFVLIEPG